ncbi:MAG TPA: hypothetical protein VFU13_09585 [Steroidobacteraceae bacterium]|nr:hypothetical protein [Steroidobacteraceae bacterium]
MSPEALALHVRLAEFSAKKSKDQDVKDAAAKARQLFDSLPTLQTQAEKDDAEKQIRELTALVLAVAAPGGKWGPKFGGAIAVVFVILTFCVLYYYIKTTGVANLSQIEYTRPLLVLTAIIATVLFGGALLFAAIFTSDDPENFSQRFRPAREIFLVFSGIFGTIIGFYFGAGDASSPQLAVSAQREQAQLVAHITGGMQPYQVDFTPEDGKTESKTSRDGWARFGIAATEQVEGELLITDSRGGQLRESVALPKPEAPAAGEGQTQGETGDAANQTPGQ